MVGDGAAMCWNERAQTLVAVCARDSYTTAGRLGVVESPNAARPEGRLTPIGPQRCE